MSRKLEEDETIFEDVATEDAVLDNSEEASCMLPRGFDSVFYVAKQVYDSMAYIAKKLFNNDDSSMW